MSKKKRRRSARTEFQVAVSLVGVRQLLRSAALHQVLLRAGAIVVAGVSVGFVVNGLREGRVALQPYQPVVACSGAAPRQDAVRVVSPGEAAALCSGAGFALADARSAEDYEQGHVPGAIHIPCSAHAQEANDMLASLADGSVLIVYGDTTEAALEVARNLQARATHHEIQFNVVDGGFPAWRDAGLACASGPCNECNEVANASSSH